MLRYGLAVFYAYEYRVAPGSNRASRSRVMRGHRIKYHLDARCCVALVTKTQPVAAGVHALALRTDRRRIFHLRRGAACRRITGRGGA